MYDNIFRVNNGNWRSASMLCIRAAFIFNFREWRFWLFIKFDEINSLHGSATSIFDIDGIIHHDL